MSDSWQTESTIIRPDWIKKLINQSEREARETKGLKLVRVEIRRALWNLATSLGFTKYGVPGRACLLLERYFYFLLRSYDQTQTEETRAILNKVKGHLMLIIACCVHLSAKMDSTESCISSEALRVALMCNGIACTTREIVLTELEIYKVLDYNIPLWTSVSIAEMLAGEMEFSCDLMTDTAVLVDMVEYLRNVIENKFRMVAKGCANTPETISTLHLAASAVVLIERIEPLERDKRSTLTVFASLTGSSNFMLTSPAPASAARLAYLAALVNAPLLYLTCIADITYGVINYQMHKLSSPCSLKRKIDD